MMLQLFAAVAAVPVAIFVLWRLLLWVAQGFWQQLPTRMEATPAAFRITSGFWTAQTMALLGAVLFVAYGAFGGAAELALGGDHAFRAVGGLVAYAAIGAICGTVMARFLPKH